MASRDRAPQHFPEGAEISDGAQDFDEAVVKTVKVAPLGKYSFETLQPTEALPAVCWACR
ncbi:hypothetical protein AB0876_33975 [Mycobacterium sp. NPDC049093]